MSLITEAVAKLDETTHGSGCGDCNVEFRRDPDAEICNYARGSNLEVRFGGRTAQVVSRYPVQTTTRPSFMAGKPLASPEQRTAALGIINAVMGFLCLIRETRACTAASHDPCLAGLVERIGSSPVYCNGPMPAIERAFAASLVDDPQKAEFILTTEDGLIDDEGLAVIERYRSEKQLILLGPATAGIAALMDLEHNCPYGR
jgi:hypothetical protein